MNLSEAWPFDFVEVRWIDAETSHGWENESEIKTPTEPVTTFGLLVKKDKKFVVVAASASWNETDQEYSFNARITIPRGMVKEINVLMPKNTEPMDLTAIVAPGSNASN